MLTRYLLRLGARRTQISSLRPFSSQGGVRFPGNALPQLRDYQQRCVDECLAELASKNRRIAVSLPTGGGKTVVFSSLINRFHSGTETRNKTLILVHRKELALQAAQVCGTWCPDKRVEVEMAEFHASPEADVVVASVQTLIRRLDKFDTKEFNLVIVDEAHHAAADSYRRVFDHFVDEETALVGFSATMRREDNKALGEVFDEIIFHMDMMDLIFQNHLSDVKFTTVSLVNADLSSVATKRGDFVIKGLSSTVNTESNNDLVIRTYLHFVSQGVKSTLVFCVDIEHVEELHHSFVQSGVSAAFVTSKTKASDRMSRIKDFKEGKIAVLLNCGIFTEGTDIPNIDCILLVRPTKSRNLLTQMIGRGLRLHDLKTFCHVVDFIGVGNQDVISTPTLGGLPSGYAVEGLSFEEMQQRGEKWKQDERERLEELERESIAATKLVEDKQMQLLAQMQEDIELKSKKLQEDCSREELDVQFTTYDSFLQFISNTSGKTDNEVTNTFDEPWILAQKNLWILPWTQGSQNVHLRLEIHHGGINAEFYKDLNFRGFEDTFPGNTEEKFYTMTLYKERPEYVHKRKGNFYTKRFSRELISPVATDIRTPLLKASSFVRETLGGIRPGKRQSWRGGRATEAQCSILNNKIKWLFEEEEDRRVLNGMREQVAMLSKGEASDLIALGKIFSRGLKQRLAKLRMEKSALVNTEQLME